MLNTSSIVSHTAHLSRLLCVLAYPRLRELPRAQWPGALRRARAIEFDLVERLAMIAAVGATAWLLQSFGVSLAEPFLRTLLQFVLAAVLLYILTAPLLLRRTRRGLDIELRRHGGTSCHTPSAVTLRTRPGSDRQS